MTRIKLENRFKSMIITVLLILSGILITINSDLNTQIAMCESTWNQTSEIDFENGIFNNTTNVGTGNDGKLGINLSGLDNWKRRTPTNNPAIRLSHAMASIYGTKKVLMFGGRGNQTWVYDLENDTWINKKPIVNHKHRDMLAMASIYGTDKVLLFGGYNSDSFPPILDDTWIYDLSNDTWVEMFPTNFPFSRRAYGMASIWGTDKIMLFGGYLMVGGYQVLNETWIYDLGDNTWTLKTPLNNPIARSGHAMASIFGDDKVVLFGGYSSSHLNDTWVFDLSDNNWTTIIPINPIYIPSTRQGHAMAAVDRTKKVVLFGGYDNGDFLKDTWVYNHFLPPRNGTYDSEPYDTGANSSFRSINWYANIPSNTNLKFQLKTATNKSGLGSKDFVGSDGNTSSFYVTSGESIWSGHTGDRWIQYKIYFNMDILDVSLSLKDITITYNCLPETIVIDPNDGIFLSHNKPVFKWTFIDVDSEEQKAFQVLIDDDITFENVSFDTGEQITTVQSWEFPIGTKYTELPDSTWYWKVRTKDEDDVWTDYSIPRVLSIDTHAPSSKPVIPENNGFYNNLNTISGISFDPAPGSGIYKTDIKIIRLKDNNYWNGTSWGPFTCWLVASETINWTYNTNSIPWESGMRYSIQSRATDFASNIELPDNPIIFTIDKDRPNSNIVFPIDDKWVNNLDTISGNSIDIGSSGIKKIEISIKCIKDYNNWDGGASENDYWNGTKWISEEAWLSVDGTTKWSYNTSNVIWTMGNQYLIASRAIDSTGNMELPGIGKIVKYDCEPPENLSIYINNGDEYSTSTSIILSLNAEDIGSGISQMAFSFTGTEWSDWEPFNTTKKQELTIDDGEKRVYFRVQDYANNIAESVFDNIVIDTMPPKDLSIIINENAKYTNSNIVSLDLFATDTLAGIGDMTFSFNKINWFRWEPYKHTRIISLPSNSYEGTNYIYFRVIDKAGNIAEPVFDTIILDINPPKQLLISINGGAIETNSTWITLELSAEDNISGVDRMSFSVDNKTWSAWEPFNHKIFYTLPPNDGEKTIYFRVKDQADNIAKPVSATISLNTSSEVPLPESQPQQKAKSNMNVWIILIIMIIIFLIIVGLAMIMKSKKRTEQELLSAGTMTIKPGGLSAPTISHGQIPATLKVPELPRTTVVPIPQQTGGQDVDTQVPQLPQSPQLPPAQVKAPTPVVSTPTTHPQQITQPILTPTPTPTPTSTPTPIPTPTTQLQPSPQVTPTPIISEPPKPQIAPTSIQPQPQPQVAVDQQQPTSDKVKKSESEQQE